MPLRRASGPAQPPIPRTPRRRRRGEGRGTRGPPRPSGGCSAWWRLSLLLLTGRGLVLARRGLVLAGRSVGLSRRSIALCRRGVGVPGRGVGLPGSLLGLSGRSLGLPPWRLRPVRRVHRRSRNGRRLVATPSGPRRLPLPRPRVLLRGGRFPGLPLRRLPPSVVRVGRRWCHARSRDRSRDRVCDRSRDRLCHRRRNGLRWRRRRRAVWGAGGSSRMCDSARGSDSDARGRFRPRSLQVGICARARGVRSGEDERRGDVLAIPRCDPHSR
jgi:hypothetical protein